MLEPMNDENRQRISALVDGELDGLIDDVLDDLAADDSLRGVWERYHLIGRSLRGEAIELPARSAALRVGTALGVEPALVPVPRSRRRLPVRLGPIAGAALAAAAVLLALVAVPALFQGIDIDSRRVPRVADLGWLSTGGGGQSGPWRQQPQALASKLDLLLVNHQEAVPGAGVKGMLPYATLVGYGSGR